MNIYIYIYTDTFFSPIPLHLIAHLQAVFALQPSAEPGADFALCRSAEGHSRGAAEVARCGMKDWAGER